MNRRIIETQPEELLRLACNYFRQTRRSLPVVERIWDARTRDYVLHARRVCVAPGKAKGAIAAAMSMTLCRAAEEGRVYLDGAIYAQAQERPPIAQHRSPVQPRVIAVAPAPRRRPYALGTRVRLAA